MFRGEGRDLTYVKLREKLRELRDNQERGTTPMIAGLGAAARLRKVASEAMKGSGILCLGPGRRMELTKKRLVSNYASPDYVIVERTAGKIAVVDAVDCYALPGPLNRDDTSGRVLEVATDSTFFRHFWAVFPEGENVAFFEEQASRLQLWNVGTVTVNPVTGPVVRHRPPTGQAIVDRRSLWLEGRV